MKTLIRNVDNVVIYAQSDLVLTETELQGDSWRDPKFSTLNARIEEAELPAHWAGAVWAYAGGAWTVFDQAQHDKIVQSTMPTLEDYDKALTDHLDAEARTHRYDNRINCALRAGYAGPYHAEGVAFAQWMDACNAAGYAILEDFQAGRIPQPTVAEVIATLPVMVWPE